MIVTIKLKEEGGITAHSLFNSRVLALAHGRVKSIVLNSCSQHCDYRTNVEYEDGFHFEYTGFSWGYNGEGPDGLSQMLKEAGVAEWITELYTLPNDLKNYILL